MKINLSLKVAIGTFFIAGTGILLVSALSFIEINSYVKENLLQNLKHELDGDAKQINSDINNIQKDVKLLTQNEQIEAIYRAMNNSYDYDAVSNDTYDSLVLKLGRTFKSILEHNDEYFNIRLLDSSGQELVVSVKDSKGNVLIQKKSKLQNKANRSYFKEAISLSKDDVYISEINLNKEHGVFSIPHIPTIRVALPIYVEDKIFAILIINTNVDKLFSILHTNHNVDKSLFIANKEGYYLFNKDKQKTFGFDLGTSYKIEDDFNLEKHLYFDNKHAHAVRKVYIQKDRFLYLALETSDRFLIEQSSAFKSTMGFYIFFITMFIAFFSLLLIKYLISPIIELTKRAKEISSGDMDSVLAFEVEDRNDEIGELSKSLKIMIQKIENSKKEIEQKVEDRTKELNELNENLESLVDEKIHENIKQLETLQEQSKMASMGEMIGAIAHQWRQPLNEIGISIQNLKYDYEDGIVNEEFLQDFITKNKLIIKFMSTTIDDFRNFYRVDKTKEIFDVKEAIEQTLSLQMAQLANNNIKIKVEGDSFEIDGFRNEFLQVVLNIINNAKDAHLANKTKDANILIRLEGKSITILDNAGGIPSDVKERIFEPYFTTKEQGKGTGMGLYMSKMIIEENMDATLSVKNRDSGAEFRMDFNET